MGRLGDIVQLTRNMGWRYIRFRSLYEVKRRSGYLKRSFPADPPQKAFITLEEWRKSARPFFFASREDVSVPQNPDPALKKEFDDIVSGKVRFFSNIRFDLGADYDWLTNPDGGFRYDAGLHWTEINDYSREAGDIKYVWEKSRFSYLYSVIRYDHHFGQDNSEFVFREMTSWMDANPINNGPNYKCSQEISIRILNWIFALYFYRNSKNLTEEFFGRMMHYIYWQLHHVYQNIDFSRIAVRNNHAITETLTLYIVPTLFPWFKAEKWRKKGKSWFEEEIGYQIYDDGTFLQFSMNYHRVVVQLLTWGIRIAGLNGDKFAGHVYDKAYKSVNFLYQCQDDGNGRLPNYGPNDGALFFRLSENDYRDYRPQLDALHSLLTGSPLYGKYFEDAQWYGTGSNEGLAPLKKQYGIIEFREGGYYLIRETETFTFIRCGNHRDRPTQADNLHIDLWYKGENILIDGGSYKYNTDEKTLRYFGGTRSHNTVMLDCHDQMRKGERFVWYDWSQCLGAKVSEEGDAYEFHGKISAFRHIADDIVHSRTVVKRKGVPEWIVTDIIEGSPDNLVMEQLWHTTGNDLIFISDAEMAEESGSYSSYFGDREASRQIVFKTTRNTVNTTISIED